ncbi:MAG: hypothetical protein ABIQ01_04880 [Pseudolysinimonas sp.]
MNEVLAFPPELLTKKHVAYLLSTSEWGVGELVRLGKLTPVKDGGKWMKFRLVDVRAYIASLPEDIRQTA